MSETEEFDVIIVGGGPAGLNTAIMCDTQHLKVLLIEKKQLGGLLANLYPNKTIPNYPGFPQITAIELVRKWLEHLRFSGVTVKRETALNLTEDLILTTDKQTYRSNVIVIATGAKPRQLALPNEEKFSNGRGVYYFPSHPEEFLGKKVVVVGGGDTAIDATLELLNLAREITLIHRKDGFRAFAMNVDALKRSGLVNFVMEAELKSIEGRDNVERVIIEQRQKAFTKSTDAVIIAIGLVPEASFCRDLRLKKDENGFILTDRGQRTSLEGVFAVGDVAYGGLRLITVAAAHGAIASHYIYSFVEKPYWSQEKWPPM